MYLLLLLQTTTMSSEDNHRNNNNITDDKDDEEIYSLTYPYHAICRDEIQVEEYIYRSANK